MFNSQLVEIDESEDSHLLDTHSATAIAKPDLSSQHPETYDQQQTLPEMVHDEDISEISKTYLLNNGRAKAGASQRGTGSIALNLSKDNKGAEKIKQSGNLTENETSTENSMLENDDEVMEIQDEKDNEESLADTENDEQAAEIEVGSTRHDNLNLKAETEKAGLYTGQTFKDYIEFTEAVEAYQQKNYFYFTTRTSKPYIGSSLDKARYPKKI